MCRYRMGWVRMGCVGYGWDVLEWVGIGWDGWG
jgi:hypothetical protein